MIKFAMVGLGGMLGSIGRYAVALAVDRWFSTVPYLATLLVNVIGCLCIGFLAALARDRWDESVRLFLVIGLLGGFTTFSSFGLDTWRLFEAQRGGVALLNVAANVFLSLLAVWVGHGLGRMTGWKLG